MDSETLVIPILLVYRRDINMKTTIGNPAKPGKVRLRRRLNSPGKSSSYAGNKLPNLKVTSVRTVTGKKAFPSVFKG